MSLKTSVLTTAPHYHQNVARYVEEETQTMLGGPWEHIAESAHTNDHNNDTSFTRSETSKEESSSAIVYPNCDPYGERVPAGGCCEEPSIIFAPSTSEDQQLSKHRSNLSRELRYASSYAELAVDEYLECYCQIHSSTEQLFAHLQDHLREVGLSRDSSDSLLQRIADNKSLLISRSNLVKEARLKRMALQNAIRQQQEVDQLDQMMYPDIETSADDSESDRSSTSDVPTVVEEYFEAAGEAFVVDERLMDLENEHHDLAMARQRDCGQEEDPSRSSVEFENIYKRTKLELGGTLAILHYRVDARRDACLAQGIDPERYRYRRLSNHSDIVRQEVSRNSHEEHCRTCLQVGQH